jgi:uncharacterized small protein (DUF1192 family)
MREIVFAFATIALVVVVFRLQKRNAALQAELARLRKEKVTKQE